MLADDAAVLGHDEHREEVKGSTTTENTIEYSTTFTGSTPVITTTVASARITSQLATKRLASRLGLARPHGQPANWATL